jgi:hypothetical protein
VTPINLLHYPFRPPDRIGNGAYRGRNLCSAVILRQLPCREDAGGDQQHALAAFLHFGSVALSPCIRLEAKVQLIFASQPCEGSHEGSFAPWQLTGNRHSEIGANHRVTMNARSKKMQSEWSVMQFVLTIP